MLTKESCIQCGKALTNNETALNKKMISRCAKEFLCIGCLAKHFRVTEYQLYEQINIYKSQRCSLFD